MKNPLYFFIIGFATASQKSGALATTTATTKLTQHGNGTAITVTKSDGSGYIFVDYLISGLDTISSLIGGEVDTGVPEQSECAEVTPQQPKREPDYVYNITTIDDLWSPTGLPFTFLNETMLDMYNSTQNTCLEVTVFSLKFNNGKSYFLGDLLGSSLYSGHDQETKGASGYYHNSICYKEIMGFGRSDRVSGESHKSIARDHVLRQIAVKMTQVMIIVVNELTVGDITYLKEFQEDLMLHNPNAHVVYIHNAFSYTEQAAMDILIKNDIQNGFDAVPHLSGGHTWWSGRNRNEKHFLFGNTGNSLGEKYNEYALSTIRQLLDQLRGEARPVDIVNRMSQVTSDSLPTIVVHPQLTAQQKFFLPTFNPNDLQVTAKKSAQTSGWLAGTATAVTKRISSLFFTVVEEGNEADMCKVYKDLSLDVYKLTSTKNLLKDGRVEMQLHLEQNITLTYFTADDVKTSTSGPELMFSVKHHAFTDKSGNLIMRFEVLDSKYTMKFENRKLILVGCRPPPNFEVASMLISDNKPQYSTFYLVIEIPDDPEEFPYDLYQANIDLKLEDKKAQDGILTLSIPKKKRKGEK